MRQRDGVGGHGDGGKDGGVGGMTMVRRGFWDVRACAVTHYADSGEFGALKGVRRGRAGQRTAQELADDHQGARQQAGQGSPVAFARLGLADHSNP